LMNILCLSEMKAHCNIDADDTRHDEALYIFADAARQAVSNFLNREVPWYEDSNNLEYVPAAVKMAMLLIVGDLYFNRESTVDKAASRNPAMDMLLYPYRVGLGI
jgi:hypothetical protein